MVIASLNGNKKNAIHGLLKIDVTRPMVLREEYAKSAGERISFNAYIVRCFAEAVKEFPGMNSFIKGNNVVLLEDINISLMVEREVDGAKVPEPVCIRRADTLSIRRIHDEIRRAQADTGNDLGNLSDSAWIRFIPSFLFRVFIRLADKNIRMASKYGKIAVSSPGMYSASSTWFIPHGTATVFLVIGSRRGENVLNDEGTPERREFLNVTASFDHEIIDGAPAARFMARFEEILSQGELLEAEITELRGSRVGGDSGGSFAK
jgi:pyruvate/2-oxoglutarate dehydrogenase complex dihydrolipoamide acyltransferase (E2) component